jgi:hypothetical protein
MRFTNDDTDVTDASLRDRSEAEVEDRPITNRHQLLGARVSDWS